MPAGVTYLWLLQQGVDSIVVPAGLGSATANTPAQQGRTLKVVVREEVVVVLVISYVVCVSCMLFSSSYTMLDVMCCTVAGQPISHTQH
jgi:hypothetical protein